MKNCLFCNNIANSKEHIVPVWLSNALERTEEEIIMNYHSLGANEIREQGKLKGFKTKSVCEHCNNGWMSQLETQVKSFLLNFVQRQLELNPNDN